MKKKLIEGKTYRIYWHDTIAIEPWCDWEQIDAKAKECAQNQETTGVYIGESNDYYIFASTINKAKNMMPFANVALIPRGCIKKIKRLK